MKIALGADHAGYPLKEAIKRYFDEKEIKYLDVGVYDTKSCDYPEQAVKLCEKITSGEAALGILCCGTGVGMSIAANKIKGIRAACCSDYFSAKYTRLHNDANVLCLGARVLGEGEALELADVFLNTEFLGGKHKRRIDLIAELENK